MKQRTTVSTLRMISIPVWLTLLAAMLVLLVALNATHPQTAADGATDSVASVRIAKEGSPIVNDVRAAQPIWNLHYASISRR